MLLWQQNMCIEFYEWIHLWLTLVRVLTCKCRCDEDGLAGSSAHIGVIFLTGPAKEREERTTLATVLIPAHIVTWLAGWLADWLTDWLAGWLAGSACVWAQSCDPWIWYGLMKKKPCLHTTWLLEIREHTCSWWHSRSCFCKDRPDFTWGQKNDTRNNMHLDEIFLILIGIEMEKERLPK